VTQRVITLIKVVLQSVRNSLTSALLRDLDPLSERSDDAVNFSDQHPGTKPVMMPKMHALTRKDQLGDNMALMQKLHPGN